MPTLLEITTVMFNSGTIASTRPETDMPAASRKCSCKKTPPAEHIELSLDSDILDALRATGEDWETCFNAILRNWLRSNKPVAA